MSLKIILLRLAGLALNIILGLLSYIIPKDDGLILVGSHNTFAGNTKAFYLYCLKNESKHNLQVYWITSNKRIYDLLRSRGLPVVYLYTLDAFKYILKAKYLLLTHGPIDVSYFYFLFGRFNMIQTWHGIPLKDISPSAEDKAPLHMRILQYLSRLNDKRYKLIVATSEETRRTFRLSFNNNNVKILGYPSHDTLRNHSLLFEDYKQKLHLYKYSKVILYCPTFRENKTKQPFSSEFLNKLNIYLRRNNYIFLVKRHPYDDFLMNDQNEYLNILDVSTQIIDIYDLLPHVDILITDYSSILFDFTLLNRPLIFYPYDIEMYIEKCRKLNYDYFAELPGPFAHNEDELLEILSNIDSIFGSKDYKERYEQFRLRFNYYNDDDNCRRLLRYLLHVD